MIRHDDEGMQGEAALVAIAKECGDHELRGCGALEDSFALVREDRDGVGLELWRMVVTIREHTPGAKAQIGSGWGRPKLKPWLT